MGKVDSEKIIKFLNDYRTQEDAMKVVNPKLMAEYIAKQNKK